SAAAENDTEVYMPIKNEAKKLAAGENPYQPLPNDSPAVAAWRTRMGTAEGQKLYRLRASTAEWVNAGCRNPGLYQLRVRGLEKARCWPLWQALAHNFLRAPALGYHP